MTQKYFEMSLVAIVCYCVLAVGVTSVFAKDKVRQEENQSKKGNETAVQNGAEKLDQDKVEKKKAEKNKVDAIKADIEKSKESKNVAADKIEKSDSPKNSTAPVVRIGTSASNHSDSLKNIGTSSFDVVQPEWFGAPLSADAKYKLVPIKPFGFDDEMLQTEINSHIQTEIDKYVDEFLGSNAHKYVHFSPAEKSELIHQSQKVIGIYNRENNQEPVEFFFAHLKFDDAFRAKAKSKWVEKHQQSRLIQYGLIAGGALLLIGFVFGGLKLNNATSGFYQGRLQFFVTIVILGVIAAGIYFGTRIDWI